MSGAFPLPRTARIAVLASGRGSNLQALLDTFGPEAGLGRVVLVISDKPRAQALERATSAGIESRYVPWERRPDFEERVHELLTEFEIDLVCLAGFMRLLSADFVEALEGRLLNVHPSLLPRFRGLHAHRQALEAGVAESGCTVHFVDAGVDSGRIVLQRPVPVLPGDDEESLAARILEQEHLAYPEAVRLVLSGRAAAQEEAQ